MFCKSMMALQFWYKRFDLQPLSLSTTVYWRSLRCSEIRVRHGNISNDIGNHYAIYEE